jgi:isoaspartyl peptidase/L-asparaginase-like protein (Ntn-hydrolase superfamily)
MFSRRKFIRSVSIATATGWLASRWQKSFASGTASSGYTAGDIVISTWDAGIAANAKAMQVLKEKGSVLDAVQQGVMVTEADPTSTSVGLSGMPDRDGHVTLDACIMDEEGNAGSVTFLEGIDHPISVARLVMEKTPHVILSGAGAQQFALQNGFILKKGMSAQARQEWEKWKTSTGYKPVINKLNHDTIGMVARSANGKFAGACTTSGTAFKMHGRVGDSPIIGSGLFLDPMVGAATATGLGEAILRICGTHTIVELMRQGLSPQQACIEAIKRITSRQKNTGDLQVGFLALNRNGEVGAFSLQSGFVYAVAREGKNELIEAPSMFKATK